MIIDIFNKIFSSNKAANKSKKEDLNPLEPSWRMDDILTIIKTKKSLNNISLPWELNDPSRRLIPKILGADNFVAPLNLKHIPNNIDFYCLWGSTDNGYTQKIIEQAKKQKKPIVRLEYGFISSYDIALNGAIQYSLVLSDNRIYYDSRGSLQQDFLEGDFELSQKEKERAERILASIHEYGITKYTLQLRSDKSNQREANKILLIDQRFGDNSLKYAGADQSNFEKMVDYALKQNKDIVVKLHPDALVGNKKSCLKDLVSKHKNIEIVSDTRNPYDLFDDVSDVYVVCSQVGLEAALYGKNVHCFGKAFYSGYGFTNDHIACRKKRNRSALELFYVYYILFSRYYIPGIGRVELDKLVSYLKFIKENEIEPSLGSEVNLEVVSENPLILKKEKIEGEIRILFVLAGGRWGATGRYIQYLAWYLQKEGAKVLVLCEGGTKSNYSGVEWRQIKFKDIGLDLTLVNEIKDFSPNIIYENGVRTIPQRAALQLKVMFPDARLVVQNEDDDIQVFEKKYPEESIKHLTMLDKPKIEINEISEFLKSVNWDRAIKTLCNPYYDRWIDPILRILFYRKADLFTSIWYPLGEELKKKFEKQYLVVPPVLPFDKYSKVGNSTEIRKKVNNKNALLEDDLIVFLPGTIYEYSDEFTMFISVLNKLRLDRRVAIFLMSKGNPSVKKLISQVYNESIKIIDLGKPEDSEYLDILIACDLVCCPGFNDRFNKLRLPSRLVKPMMMGKPVITYKTGFGESLKDGENAILLTEDTEDCWCRVFENAFNNKNLTMIGKLGQKFAKENLDAKQVAKNLYGSFLKLVK